MINRGKSVLAMMAQSPTGKVSVMPSETGKGTTGPLVGTSGRTMFRLAPRPGQEHWTGLANDLNMWLQGDLSFLDKGGPALTQKPGKGPTDKDMRKRADLADLLEGRHRLAERLEGKNT